MLRREIKPVTLLDDRNKTQMVTQEAVKAYAETFDRPMLAS